MDAFIAIFSEKSYYVAINRTIYNAVYHAIY